MGAWGTALDPTGKSGIRFLADPHGELTSALDLSFDGAAIFGNARSKRYALVVEDGKVTQAHVEPDNTGLNGMLSVPSYLKYHFESKALEPCRGELLLTAFRPNSQRRREGAWKCLRSIRQDQSLDADPTCTYNIEQTCTPTVFKMNRLLIPMGKHYRLSIVLRSIPSEIKFRASRTKVQAKHDVQ